MVSLKHTDPKPLSHLLTKFSNLLKNVASICLSDCLLPSEYLRGNVLPAEQHAASDLQSLLDAYANVKTLNTHSTPQLVSCHFRFLIFRDVQTVSCFDTHCHVINTILSQEAELHGLIISVMNFPWNS